MQPTTDSQPVPTEPKNWLQRVIAGLDPDFPSLVVAGPELLIGDTAVYGNERVKPQFVIDDDLDFLGGRR